MGLLFSRHLKVAAGWFVIGVIGLAAGWLAARSLGTVRLEELTDHAEFCAAGLDEAELGRLAGTRADLGTPGYLSLKEKLRRLQAVDGRVRFAYVFRRRPEDGHIVFLADSAPPGSRDESLPGDEYRHAAVSPGLQAAFQTNRPATEGPLADDFGTWMTAYAPVGTWRPETGGARHLVGLDVDAADWARDGWLMGVERMVMVWILLGIPLGTWLVFRRQREQNEVIRNLSEAMEQSHSAILITDPEGRIEYVNRGLCRQSGYSRRQLLGHGWRHLLATDAGELAGAEIAASLRAGRAWEGEWTCRRGDGGSFPVRGGFTPVRRRDGAIAGFVAIFDDVTEVRRRETELREATELAQAADRAKGQFLATMSHEVRTPLNGIVGFTTLLLETPLTPEQAEYVRTIRVSTEALNQLTGDILDFARIESGRVKLDPSPCNPRECVEETLDLVAARADEKHLDLLHRVESAVPAAILIDGGRLRQVLLNLVGNAIKFTERGEVEVTVALEQREPAPGKTEEGCRLRFTVRDTGIGIPPEHHAKLFRAFSQVDDSTTRRHGGSGLGLAISRNLVGLMGGSIRVESAVGAGSTFEFTVQAGVCADPPPPGDLGGKRILLVAAPGALRREWAARLREWNAAVGEVDDLATPLNGEWDIALVDIVPAVVPEGTEPVDSPGATSVARYVGLVPIATSAEKRAAWRRRFHQLVNKPVHYEALYAVLAGTPARRLAPGGLPRKFDLRVLVVEDHPVNRRLAERVLQNLGCTPALVTDGQEALRLLTEHAEAFDVILLDLHMPEMDGLSLLAALRAGKAGARAQGLWVIALTADARDEQRREALAAGLNDYLTKPLQPGALEAALQRYQEERSRPRG